MATQKTLERNAELVRRGLVETEAEQLLSAAWRKVTGKSLSRMDLYSQLREVVPSAVLRILEPMVEKRAEGRLLQHVTGYQVFLDHEYEVGPEVLVPRPETEMLVTLAMNELCVRKKSPRHGLEVGIGSGAISIELLARFPTLTMVATELTERAMANATKNAAAILELSADRLRILQAGDPLAVLEPFQMADLPEKADFLISNPPYLTQSDEIDAEVTAYEPWTALFAPKADPLHFYRAVARDGAALLAENGVVYLELATERATQVLELFTGQGWSARLVKDLPGRDRFLIATPPARK